MIYIIIDDLKLSKLKELSEVSLNNLQDIINNNRVNLKDYWDSIHYLLTEKIDFYENKNKDFFKYAKSIFIFGEKSILSKNYISYIKNQTMREIFNQIERVDFTLYRRKFCFEKFLELGVLTDTFSDKNEDEIFEILKENFEKLKLLYKKALYEDKNILICLL